MAFWIPASDIPVLRIRCRIQTGILVRTDAGLATTNAVAGFDPRERIAQVLDDLLQ